MTGVSSLSGYVKNVNFSEEEGMLLFSILVNGNSMGQSAARTVIDQIVVNLAQIQNCWNTNTCDLWLLKKAK